MDDKLQLKTQSDTEGGAAAVQQDEVPRQGKNLAAGMLFCSVHQRSVRVNARAHTRSLTAFTPRGYT